MYFSDGLYLKGCPSIPVVLKAHARIAEIAIAIAVGVKHISA